MPRRGQHDQSPGDARKPFSDQGGPEGRHAQTHDVEREEASRPKGPQPEEDFSDDLAASPPPAGAGGHADESHPAAQDKELQQELAELDSDELARLTVLTPGTRLEQGGTYVDLKDLPAGPFKAMGSQEAGPENSYVAKRDTDYELWNRLVGQGREPEIERPAPADG